MEVSLNGWVAGEIVPPACGVRDMACQACAREIATYNAAMLQYGRHRQSLATCEENCRLNTERGHPELCRDCSAYRGASPVPPSCAGTYGRGTAGASSPGYWSPDTNLEPYREPRATLPDPVARTGGTRQPGDVRLRFSKDRKRETVENHEKNPYVLGRPEFRVPIPVPDTLLLRHGSEAPGADGTGTRVTGTAAPAGFPLLAVGIGAALLLFVLKG